MQGGYPEVLKDSFVDFVDSVKEIYIFVLLGFTRGHSFVVQVGCRSNANFGMDLLYSNPCRNFSFVCLVKI